ncbi:hypothetical protein D9757_013634 [Collybiopsis confluens]|uniref:Uncharacterized protein n=1 Tax=Collybiopsis confluens TaxID=2823264 RepID=A0A8H5FV73_9AGAR|nr:hypothetical protein D9757_013634 [Collybiopsis confluens]
MNTQDIVVSDKITVRSARSTVQQPPRKRRRLAKNLFIQDEAEVDDSAEESERDRSGEDVEDENGLDFEDGTDNETFQTDLSGFREHQSLRVPSLFADVIQRIENSPLERVDTIKVSDFWQDNQIFLQNALYQHPRAPDVSQRHTVYHVRCHVRALLSFNDSLCGFAGQVSDILGPSIARRSDEEDQDYSRYYVNIFADRDMVIRFCPDLTLGAHIATSIPMEYASLDVESEEEVDEEELDEEEKRMMRMRMRLLPGLEVLIVIRIQLNLTRSSSAPPPPMTTEQIVHALAEQVASLTAAVSGRAAAKLRMNKPDLFKGQNSMEARRFLAQFIA